MLVYTPERVANLSPFLTQILLHTHKKLANHLCFLASTCILETTLRDKLKHLPAGYSALFQSVNFCLSALPQQWQALNRVRPEVVVVRSSKFQDYENQERMKQVLCHWRLVHVKYCQISMLNPTH